MRTFFRHQRRMSQRLLTRVLLPVSFAAALLVPSVFAATGINPQINYQGKLTDTSGTSVSNGAYNMRFRLYAAPTGGNHLWSETRDNTTQRVTATGGLFSIALGSYTTMTGSVDFNSDSLYLQVEFDPGNDGVYEEVFAPRRRFASVPYALNSRLFDGLQSVQFLRADTTTYGSGTIVIKPNNARKFGIDILSQGGSSATGALRLSTQGGPHILFGSGGANYDTNLYRVSANTLKTDDSFHVVGTISGSIIHAEKTLSSSGLLIVSQRTKQGSGALVVEQLANSTGAYIVSHATTNPVLALDAWAESSTAPHILFGYKGTFDVALWRSAAATLKTDGSLHVMGTLSGNNLYVAKSISGTNLYIASTIGGAGLASCNGSTSKLLYNTSTKQFSCGTDLNTSWSNTGSLRTSFDARYVNTSGDTMTGTLVLNPASGYAINARGTISGSLITQNGAGDNYFRGNLGIGTTSPSSLLSVAGTMDVTGVATFANENTLFTSGTASLYFDELGNDGYGAKRITSNDGCGNFNIRVGGYCSGGIKYAITGDSYANIELNTESLDGYILFGVAPTGTAGDTVTESYMKLETTGLVFTSGLQIQPNSADSETAPAYTWDADEDTGLFRATANTIGLTTAGTERMRITSAGLVGIGTTAPEATLDVVGTISGSRLIISSNATVSGSLVVINKATFGTSTALTTATVNILTPSGSNYRALSLYSSTTNNIAKGGIIAGARKDNSLDTFAGIGLWDNGSRRTVFVGGGSWLTPDATHLDFYTSSTYDETNGTTANLRAAIDSTGLKVVGNITGTSLNIKSTVSNESVNMLKIVTDYSTSNNTVFRITASGAVYADGKYNSAGADYAEWFKTPDKNFNHGDLVCVDILQNNTVRKCTRSGDPNLMGIVSTNPSFVGNAIGGADGIIPPGYVLVGLIGQVPANVMIESGAIIRPGDALTSASVAGFARRAYAGESTVGVALEGYDGTQQTNFINVLISRRNQSVTVEAVEQHIAESIASMGIDDQIKQSMQTAMQGANIDARITAALDEQIASLNLDARIEKIIDARIASGSFIDTAYRTELSSRLTALASSSALLTSRFQAIEVNFDELSEGITLLQSSFSGGVFHTDHAVIGDLTVTKTLTVSGLTLMSGTSSLAVSLSGSELQIGSLMATGSLKVFGNITITGLALFLGDVDIQGELSVSRRQAGFATISTNASSVTVSFDPPWKTVPVINVTPHGRVGAEWWIAGSSATGFTIATALPLDHDVLFAWSLLGVQVPETIHGAAVEVAPLIPFPVNERMQPFSSDTVWNGCIQGRPLLDLNGEPLSCARYHEGYNWQQPDLGVTFIYNPNHEPPILTIPEGYVITVLSTGGSSSGDETPPPPADDSATEGDETPPPPAEDGSAEGNETPPPPADDSGTEGDETPPPADDTGSGGDETPPPAADDGANGSDAVSLGTDASAQGDSGGSTGGDTTPPPAAGPTQ